MNTTMIIAKFVTPVSIAFIMFGLGLSLTLDDFKRVWVHPKAMSTGIILQIIGLPILGFIFVSALGFDPVLAASVMLISACPGGAITNLVSFVSKGDAALSVSLTAINSFITVVTIPIVTTLSLGHFMGAEAAARVNILNLSLGILIITIPPIIIGMLTKYKAPDLAKKAEGIVRKGTISFLALLLIYVCYLERQTLLENYKKLATVATTLCFLYASMGVFVGNITRLPKRHILTLAIEVGLPNSGMGIVIALSFLGIPAFAVFCGLYMVIEYILAGIVMATMNSMLGRKILGDEYS